MRTANRESLSTSARASQRERILQMDHFIFETDLAIKCYPPPVSCNDKILDLQQISFYSRHKDTLE